jgi:hypothetical protein
MGETMRLWGLSATALVLALVGCAGPYPGPASYPRPQYAHAHVRPIHVGAISPRQRHGRAYVPTAGAEVSLSPVGVPVISVEQVCQGIAEQGGVTFRDTGKARAKRECVDSEHEVRDKLTTTWGSFHAADQTHCVRETRMGGESSYTELITCLEMARAVRKIHEEAEAARHPQNVGQR